MLTFFLGGWRSKNRKTSKTTTTHGGIPINQVRQQKSLVGTGHGVFPGILLLQGGGGRGEKDFKGLERWDEHLGELNDPVMIGWVGEGG